MFAICFTKSCHVKNHCLKEEGGEADWQECFKGNNKARGRILSLVVKVGIFVWHLSKVVFILTFRKKKREKKNKKRDFITNHKRLFGACRFLYPLAASLLTFHQPLRLPATCINNMTSRGAANQQPSHVLVPQFRAFNGSRRMNTCRGRGRDPTGWSTGARSAGVAAITSCHSLYWPPPIGFLLNLKPMQLFLLDGGHLNTF